MSPRKISIHQVGLGASVRDAAADTMPVVRQMLGELGFNSEIFVDGDERSLRLRAQDLLLIHHCGFQYRFDWLAGLRCRKALIYHGMTPPRYFAQDTRDYDLSVKAHAQLSALRGIVEAGIALSSRSARRLQQRGFGDVSVIPFFKDCTNLRSIEYFMPGMPSSLATRTTPPWFSATCFTIARPSPVPPVSRERARSTR